MSGGGGFGEVNKIKKPKKDDSDDEETNEYYVGGTDGHGGGSGLSVMTPKKKGEGDEKDIYKKMIDLAKQDAQEKPLQGEEEVVIITLYRNGFTVGDGPLRERGVAANDRFLSDLSQRRCPQELIKNGQPQDVKLVDKSGQDYDLPAYVAFSGEGNAIGGTKREFDQSAIIPPRVLSGNEKPLVDDKEKTIRVQVKYLELTGANAKDVLKFNLHHTVNDLIKMIHLSGKTANKQFVLQDSKRQTIGRDNFPLTLTDAGLANAVVFVTTQI